MSYLHLPTPKEPPPEDIERHLLKMQKLLNDTPVPTENRMIYPIDGYKLPTPPKNVPSKPIKLSSEKNILEKDVEGDNGKYCKKLGVMFEKYSSPQKMSVPDRMLTFANGLIVFIEYKRPGAKATEKQFLDHQSRRKRGVLVYVVDNAETGRRLIARLLQMEAVKGALAQELHNNKLNYTNDKVVEK